MPSLPVDLGTPKVACLDVTYTTLRVTAQYERADVTLTMASRPRALLLRDFVTKVRGS